MRMRSGSSVVAPVEYLHFIEVRWNGHRKMWLSLCLCVLVSLLICDRKQ